MLEDDEAIVRARLAELDALIFDARSALQRLVDTRAEVAATVNDFVTVHSPVRVLPDDILLSIFLFCAPKWDDCVMRCWDCGQAGFGEDSLFDDHWAVAQVCRRWRAVSLSYGPLWSYIILPCDFGSPTKLAATEALLARSKGVELSVEIDGICKDGKCRGTRLSMLAERCKRLRIPDVCCSAHVPIMFPRLSSLAIIYNYSTRENQDAIQAPRLEVYEEYCSGLWDSVLAAFNPALLREFKIKDFCPDRFPLLNLSSITTLTLEQLFNPKTDGFLGTLHFPSLRNLRLADSDTYEILGYTTMPQLETLKLYTKECFTHDEDKVIQTCTIPTFASPPHNLTKLDITHIADRGCRFFESLPPLFAATTNVTDLRLFLQPNGHWKDVRTEDVIDILHARHGLLPRLTTLWVGDPRVVREGMPALKKVIASRKGRLEHFGVMDIPSGLMIRWDNELLATLKSELESSKTYIDLGMEILI